MVALSDMNKDQLTARAQELGITEEEELRTVDSLRAAIRDAEAQQEQQQSQTQEPAKPEGISYIVGGVRVDPNGKPV